jgi:hypothetical protein
MMSVPLVNGGSQTAALFNSHLLFYYDMAEVPSSTFNPRARRLTPSTLILITNFIPLQLQSSLPTSSLVTQLQPSSPFKFQTLSLCYFLHSP